MRVRLAFAMAVDLVVLQLPCFIGRRHHLAASHHTEAVAWQWPGSGSGGSGQAVHCFRLAGKADVAAKVRSYDATESCLMMLDVPCLCHACASSS